DLFLHFENQGVRTSVLVEVKVHDYLSATPGQIKTYYDAAVEENNNDQVYFIYLTQFNRSNFPSEGTVIMAPTIREFDDSNTVNNAARLKHINWREFHEFIEQYREILSPEETLMLDLQKNWITAKSLQDINNNTVDVGERTISEYFGDIDLEQELTFGKLLNKNKRQNLLVDLSKCSTGQLESVLNAINTLLASDKIDKKPVLKTEESTLKAAREFLSALAEDETNWGLLSFYSALFDRVSKTEYLLLNGTGTRGFSIRVGITGKGSISLCTLWSNKTIEFSLKR
ncbi:MAG: hypothetical protein ACYC21_06780, partial [Eubacteriales bacterium]